MSKIEWTDKTSNPIRKKGGGWYCVKVSRGCKHCYAERLNQSPFYGGNKLKYKVMPQLPEMELIEAEFGKWRRYRKSYKIFVESMSDLGAGGELFPVEFTERVLEAMLECPHLIFQILTKRAEQLKLIINAFCYKKGIDRLPAHIWVGFSAEDQYNFEERFIHSRDTFATTRFISFEPLVGPIHTDFQHIKNTIHWVIVGGESGPKAEPMHPKWATDIVEDAFIAGIPVFFKQWGHWMPAETMEWSNHGSKYVGLDGKLTNMASEGACLMMPVGKKKAGALIDGREIRQFPHTKKVAA